MTTKIPRWLPASFCKTFNLPKVGRFAATFKITQKWLLLLLLIFDAAKDNKKTV